MCGLERLALAGADGDHLYNPVSTVPIRSDVLRSLFGAQGPGDVTTVANRVIRRSERDVPFPKELTGDLSVEALVRLDGQQEVGPLLRELSKNGRWVCGASAWINTPSRSSSPSNFLSTARSWFSPVA